MGADHPIAWSHAYEGGRAFYTGLGHTVESYSEPRFLTHLLGGIRWAADLEPPAIRSVAATVAGRRLTVRVRTAHCRPCDGTLLVRLPDELLAFPLRGGRAVTRPLPRGRWRYTVTVLDRPSGLRASVTRSVTV
jgi:hypothetical protein